MGAMAERSGRSGQAKAREAEDASIAWESGGGRDVRSAAWAPIAHSDVWRVVWWNVGMAEPIKAAAAMVCGWRLKEEV